MDKIIILTGPTATGKSKLSLKLMEKFPFEIVNCDSMQIYKYFDIGTDKPPKEILQTYPHHLISYIDPTFYFHVKNYIEDALKIIQEIKNRGKFPLFVGGTGLYIKCLLFGIIEDNDKNEQFIRENLKQYNYEYLSTKLKTIDFDAFKKINKNDKYRTIRALSYYFATGELISNKRKTHNFQQPKFSYLKFAIEFDRETLYNKINNRVDIMISNGLIEEVEYLLDRGYDNTRPMNGIGYKEIRDFLLGKCSKKDAIELIKQNSRKYAKRQITWFKKEKDINWINLDNLENIFEKIEKFLYKE